MLNKNTLGVKKVRGQLEAVLWVSYMLQKSSISTAAKKLIKNSFSHLKVIRTFTTMIGFVNWPRDETESGHPGNSGTFCLGQAGLICLIKYPGLTQVMNCITWHLAVTKVMN